MKPVQIAVIGTGSISDLHLRSYKNNPHAEIAMVCDLNEARAKAKAEEYGVKGVATQFREVFDNPDIDAVSICTWNNTHADLAIAALESGKHVLVEKPLASSLEAALRVKRAAEKTDKHLMVGYVRRFDNNIDMIKRFAEAGEFGEFYYAKASTIRRLGNPGGWFADKERSGGGPLIDLGVHIIDLCWYLMGRPKAVSVSGNAYRKLGNRSNVRNLSFYKAADYDPVKNTVEDFANALIRFENGASLMVETSYTLHALKDETTVKLYGDKGGLEIEPAVTLITEKHDTILNAVPQTDNASLDVYKAFQNEIDHFIDSIRTNTTPISSVDDGLEIMKILSAIYESAETGKEVRL